MTTVAERLQYLLESRDMKQKELADRVGISKQSLYQYLHCKCEPRAEIIAKMAAALGTTADFIVGLTADPAPREYDPETEMRLRRETAMLTRLRQLTPENRIRLAERVDCLLEQQS